VSLGCSAVGPAISETDEPVDDSEFGSGGLIETDQTDGSGGTGGADVPVVDTPTSGGAPPSVGGTAGSGGTPVVVGAGGAQGSGGWSGGTGAGGLSAVGGSGGSADPVPEPSWSWTRDAEAEYLASEDPAADGYMNIEVFVTCQGREPYSARIASQSLPQNLQSGATNVVLEWEIPVTKITSTDISTPWEYFNCEGRYAGANRYLTIKGDYRIWSTIGSGFAIPWLHVQLSSDVSISTVRVLVDSVEWWGDGPTATYLSERYTVELWP